MARTIAETTPEELDRAVDALVALVASRLPERFYPSEPVWRLPATALISRIAGQLDTLRIVHLTRRPSDASVALRALYESVVTLCWLLIDPPTRVMEWAAHAARGRVAMHNDALPYGERVLTNEQLKRSKHADKLAAVDVRAREVDGYWSTRGLGFNAPAKGTPGLLTLHGLYVALYRGASRSAHAQVDSLDACVDYSHRRPRVVLEDAADTVWAAMGVPLAGLALLACSERLLWPDPATVHAIVDRFTSTFNQQA